MWLYASNSDASDPGTTSSPAFRDFLKFPGDSQQQQGLRTAAQRTVRREGQKKPQRGTLTNPASASSSRGPVPGWIPGLDMASGRLWPGALSQRSFMWSLEASYSSFCAVSLSPSVT